MGNTERLQYKKNDLQEQWEFLSKKLSGLERDRILETRSEEQLRLDEEIIAFKERRRVIEEELEGIEQQLLALVSDPTFDPARETDNRACDEQSGSRISGKTAAAEPKRVVLIYKRDVRDDERLVALLEKELTAAGYYVFIDKHLKVGVKWAKQIAAELTCADAVVIILSPGSVQSDMLAYEIEIASQAARKNKGGPRLLPVRIRFEEPLPPEISGNLTALQYALWQGPEDDARVIREILAGIADPQSVPPQGRLEMTGGAMPPESRFYVVRPADEDFADSIARRDSIVLIKGARQIGKTSLLARGLDQVRKSDFQIILTDFQKLGNAELHSLEDFYLTLGEMLADQLGLAVLPEDTWKPRRSPNANFERYLCRTVLSADIRLIWAMDEADRLFSCDFGSEVFALFRSWHNERALNPNTPLSRLTLAIAYATEAHLFIRDPTQTPSNLPPRLDPPHSPL